jgi:outer membrane protein OmpU
MKKILLTTTLLVATAGMAAAEDGVSFSGYGRFGLVYLDDGTDSDTQLQTRLRININASLETDSGLTFGGRIRLQHTNGDTNSVWVDANGDGIVDPTEEGVTGGGARLSAAKLFVESGGFRLEVGNTDGAFDNAGLMYASEIGFTDSSLGESRADFFGFSSGPYGVEQLNRMGIYASYSVGDFTARISLIDPDQGNDADEEEVSISFDYVTGPFSISLGAAQDGAGIADNDLFFVGAAYAIGDNANVGLNYHDDGDFVGDTTTLYGNYTLASGLTIAGYITSVDDVGAGDSETGGGIGASYPIGEGAKVAGAIHQLDDVTFADLGVRFDF